MQFYFSSNCEYGNDFVEFAIKCSTKRRTCANKIQRGAQRSDRMVAEMINFGLKLHLKYTPAFSFISMKRKKEEERTFFISSPLGLLLWFTQFTQGYRTPVARKFQSVYCSEAPSPLNTPPRSAKKENKWKWTNIGLSQRTKEMKWNDGYFQCNVTIKM